MNVYKVDRKVDTVIIEMDISTANKLAEVLRHVDDVTSTYTNEMDYLLGELYDKAGVRTDHPLYRAVPHADGVLLRNTTSKEMDEWGERRSNA